MLGRDIFTFTIQAEIPLEHNKSKVIESLNEAAVNNLHYSGGQDRRTRQHMGRALQGPGERNRPEAESNEGNNLVPQAAGGGQEEGRNEESPEKVQETPIERILSIFIITFNMIRVLESWNLNYFQLATRIKNLMNDFHYLILNSAKPRVEQYS